MTKLVVVLPNVPNIQLCDNIISKANRAQNVNFVSGRYVDNEDVTVLLIPASHLPTHEVSSYLKDSSRTAPVHMIFLHTTPTNDYSNTLCYTIAQTSKKAHIEELIIDYQWQLNIPEPNLIKSSYDKIAFDDSESEEILRNLYFLLNHVTNNLEQVQDGRSEIEELKIFNQNSKGLETTVQMPTLSRKNLFKIKNYIDETFMLKYRVTAYSTLVQVMTFREGQNANSDQPDVSRMEKAVELYCDLEPLFTKNSPLDLKDKIIVIAKHFERRSHRVAQGDGEEYTSAISHTKFLINQQIEGVKVPSTDVYKTLAFTIPDKGGLLDGKREPGTVIPAHYVWGYDQPVASPLELMLIGRKKKALVSPADTVVLEQAFREGKLKDKYVTLERIGKVNGSVQPFTRALYLFGNELAVPIQWQKNQTNLFCSLFVDSSAEFFVYHHLLKHFQATMEGFKILYVKQLQHALNFYYYNLRKEMQKSKGSVEFEKLVYYGTGAIVPRTIVLGTAHDFWRAEAKKSGKHFPNGIELASEPWYADQFAYHCKNLQPGQAAGRKQMLVCYLSLGNCKKVDKPVPLDHITNDCIYSTVEGQYGQTSTVYAVTNPLLVYPMLLIEYEPVDNKAFQFAKETITETAHPAASSPSSSLPKN